MATDPVVLVGGDSHELGFGENEGPEVLRPRHVFRLRIDVDDVEARLVAVHGVEDDLNTTRRHVVTSYVKHVVTSYTKQAVTSYTKEADDKSERRKRAL